MVQVLKKFQPERHNSNFVNDFMATRAAEAKSVRNRKQSKLPLASIAPSRMSAPVARRSNPTRRLKAEGKEIVTIIGEPFELSSISGNRVLKHARWSLMGIGKTRAEAHAALFQEASEIADFYCSKPNETLSADAIELKNFLLRLLS